MAASMQTNYVFADTENVIVVDEHVKLRWNNAIIVIPSISASKQKISASILITTQKSSDTINGYMYLEEKSGKKWKQVKSWKINQTGTLDLTKSYTGKKGSIYRTKVDVKVSKEKITAESDEIIL